jgi:dihydrodipicolinate synthase/N-acetylneuraminate lyase
MKLQGMFALAATPFDHTGAIYRAKVEHNFAKWRRTSLAGFIVGSLAGEGSLLTPAEKIEVMEIAAATAVAKTEGIKIAGAGVPGTHSTTLIGDVSNEGVHAAVELARAMAKAGAHAVISRAPHEYRHLPHSADFPILYFRALADQSPVPVVIQNAPVVTEVDLSPSTIAMLAQHPNIAGVVGSGTPVSRVEEIRARVGKDFAILSGTESLVWESLRVGANGAALAFASAAPYATIAIWEAFRTREEEAGIDWQGRIAHPSILVTAIHGPAGLKHAMDINGYYGGLPRLPFPPVNDAAKQEIEEAFRDLKG